MSVMECDISGSIGLASKSDKEGNEGNDVSDISKQSMLVLFC